MTAVPTAGVTNLRPRIDHRANSKALLALVAALQRPIPPGTTRAMAILEALRTVA